MMSKPRERNNEPVTVPFAATPAGKPPSMRDWANPCVWTDRMLTTLEQGVRGGKWHCRGSVFRQLDGWIRGRLRSMLRRRQKRHGRARGKDHQRWPNHFFDEHGLYSLQTAHIRFVQSSPR